MDTVQPNNIDPAAPPRRAGYLLAPFGWAAEPLLALAHAEPALLSHLFELPRHRMHAIALTLAHIDGSVSPQFAQFLACASSRQIIIQVLGRSPTGITRV